LLWIEDGKKVSAGNWTWIVLKHHVRYIYSWMISAVLCFVALIFTCRGIYFLVTYFGLRQSILRLSATNGNNCSMSTRAVNYRQSTLHCTIMQNRKLRHVITAQPTIRDIR
jgi:hypothetical protein